MADGPLIITEKVLPGSTWLTVELAGERVGGIEVVEGGFVPFGCRRPSPTLAHALGRLALGEARSLRRRAARIEAALQAWLEASPANDAGPGTLA